MRAVSFDTFFAAVRAASLPAIWSDGVTLAREGAVRRDRRTDDELCFRVRASGHAVDVSVSLYVLDDEWSCTCGGHADPCSHVAAAAIAEKQGQAQTDDGAESATAAAPALAHVAYHFTIQEHRLLLRRAIRQPDGSETKLVGLLSSAMAARKVPSNLAPTQNDLRVDRITEGRAELRVPMHEISALFDALASSEHVSLEGAAARVAPETILPVAEIADDQGGFLVTLRAPPELEQVIARGVGRAGGVLRPLAQREVAGDRFEHLPVRKRYGARDAATLAQIVVPELEATMADVQIKSRKLPARTQLLRPRLDFEMTHQDGLLFVLPRIVYGDPPVARVEGDTLVSLGNVAPKRRPEEENHLTLALRDALNLVPGRKIDFRGAEAARFLSELRRFREARGEEGKEFEAIGTLEAHVSLDGSTLDVWFEGDGHKADAPSVLSAWRAGLELVPLLGGGFAKIPKDWLQKHGARVTELLAARDDAHKVPPVLAPELNALCKDLEIPTPPDLQRLVQSFAFDAEGAMAAPTLAADLRAELREYQQHGAAWLCGLAQAELGGILADDMGLGKTVQTLATLQGRTLVVCPKSVVFNWAREIERFRPGLRAHVHERGALPAASEADIVLITYARLRLDIEALASEPWDNVVLDEAQAIKNASSQTARAAFRLQGRFRLALSGTPVENRLEELWSLLHFSTPGLLGAERTFAERFAEPIANGNESATAALRQRIRPFLLRRTKREVLRELPPRTEVSELIELDPQERLAYDTVLAASRREVTTKLGEGQNALAILEALLRLRQAACHRGLLPGEDAASSSKVERLAELLEELAAEGHRALVFSQWTSLLDRVEPHLRARELTFDRIDGSARR